VYQLQSLVKHIVLGLKEAISAEHAKRLFNYKVFSVAFPSHKRSKLDTEAVKIVVEACFLVSFCIPLWLFRTVSRILFINVLIHSKYKSILPIIRTLIKHSLQSFLPFHCLEVWQLPAFDTIRKHKILNVVGANLNLLWWGYLRTFMHKFTWNEIVVVLRCLLFTRLEVWIGVHAFKIFLVNACNVKLFKESFWSCLSESCKIHYFFVNLLLNF